MSCLNIKNFRKYIKTKENKKILRICSLLRFLKNSKCFVYCKKSFPTKIFKIGIIKPIPSSSKKAVTTVKIKINDNFLTSSDCNGYRIFFIKFVKL